MSQSSHPALTVLMYHALLEKSVPGVGEVHVEVGLFARHMAWLHAHGYQVLTVPALYHRLRAGQPLAGCVVLSFDDGYLSLLRHAAPILARYDFAPTLFVTTGFVGQPDYRAANFARSAPPADRPLSWPEIRELHRAGWDIQAHSCTHPPHAGLPPAHLHAELAGSKRLLSEHLGLDAQFYAFPYGSYDRHALRALATHGYVAGFSVHSGQVTPASDLRRLPRAEVNTSCDLDIFAHLVQTGYASPVAGHRARLRDAVFHFPLLKDALQAVFNKAVN
jgi:peptidoglycan/xylan/chitin deacetylase (PgdA/CDA1 family)